MIIFECRRFLYIRKITNVKNFYPFIASVPVPPVFYHIIVEKGMHDTENRPQNKKKGGEFKFKQKTYSRYIFEEEVNRRRT